MKLKTTLALSLVVNAIFVIVVGYMLAIEIPIEAGPLLMNGTNAPAATSTSMAMTPH